jgi:hypothetical protein
LNKTLTWKTVNIVSKGNNTTEKDTDMTKICQQSKVKVKEELQFLFSKMDYKNAQLTCKKMGGKMPLPTKEKDFNATIGEEYYSNGISTSECKKLWLPIVQVEISFSSCSVNKTFHLTFNQYIFSQLSKSKLIIKI